MDTNETFKIVTPSGATFEYVRVMDVSYPKEDSQLWDLNAVHSGIRNIKARTDDVVVCGFLRSGTNWLWEIVNMLVRSRAEYEKDRKWSSILECHHSNDYFSKIPSPRVLSSHYNFYILPHDFKDKNCKIIYIQRNPKDVAWSHFNYRNDEKEMFIEWNDYLHLFMNSPDDCYDSWFGTTKSWEKGMEENPDIPILFVYYEDLIKNTEFEIRRIAQFLEVRDDLDLIRHIAKKVSFDNMKQAKIQYVTEALEQDPTCAKREYGNSVEKRSKYYRKGKVGDWKNHFTVAQNELFDDALKKRMNNSKLKFTYCLQVPFT